MGYFNTLVKHPRPESLDGLLNLYKPLFYMVPFLLGYFVFAHDAVQEKLKKYWIPLLAAVVVSGAALGYMMKMYTPLCPWAMYLILTVAVFTLSPLLYEILRRIPVVRWCVFGEKRK